MICCGGGGAEGDRTPDLVIANDALSQLSYGPTRAGPVAPGAGVVNGAAPVLAGTMRDAVFFGYGSLVNGVTHAYPGLRAARLDGWGRGWRRAPGRRVSLLTALPGGNGIDGALAIVPGGDWAALDAREASYARHPARARSGTEDVAAAVYAVTAPVPSEGAPILMSYLEVVVQGFLDLHGAGGATRFFAETDGWEAPVFDDRAAPLYPRHVPPSAEASRVLADGLEGVGARFGRPPEGWP